MSDLNELMETGLKFHGYKCPAAGCFLDGIMTATGCTYGKSNIEKKYYNKMAFTLIDVATGRSVRVKLNDEFMKNALNSPFVNKRKEGVPPQDISPEISDPIVNKVLTMDENAFIEIGEVKEIDFKRGKGHFEAEKCDSCGELTFSNKLYETSKGKVCAACTEEV